MSGHEATAGENEPVEDACDAVLEDREATPDEDLPEPS